MATRTIYLTPPLRGQSEFVRVYSGPIDLENDHLELHLRQQDKNIPDIWAIQQIRYNATMSAVVGNRLLQMQHRTLWDGLSDIILMMWQSEAVPASNSGSILAHCFRTASGITYTIGGNVCDVINLARDEYILLGPSDYLRFYTGGPKAGDVGFVYATFRYLNYFLGIATGGR